MIIYLKKNDNTSDLIRQKPIIYCTDKPIENWNLLSYHIKVIARAPSIILPA